MRCLVGLGLDEGKLQLLERARNELLDLNRFGSNDAWLAQFSTRFQLLLDEAAQGRIEYYARRAGAFSAISPNALVDSLLASYCAFMMLSDLCRIYHLRVGRLDTLVLLGHVFFQRLRCGRPQ